MNIKIIHAVEELIDDTFSRITVPFLGIIPKITRERKITFEVARKSLTSLYLQSLGTRNPTADEEGVLKGLIKVANGYMDKLKGEVKSKIIHGISTYMSEAKLKNQEIDPSEIKQIYQNEFDNAKYKLDLIVNCESNGAINLGTAMQIKRVAESQGIQNPTVYFLVTIDDVTGPYEFILHLLPDRITPRVWRLSEIVNDFYKPGDQYPSTRGLHPNCRCRLLYLPKGFGFSSGRMVYKGPDWDEFKTQREEYGLPLVPAKVNATLKRKLKGEK